jgi:hypothetical protein
MRWNALDESDVLEIIRFSKADWGRPDAAGERPRLIGLDVRPVSPVESASLSIQTALIRYHPRRPLMSFGREEQPALSREGDAFWRQSPQFRDGLYPERRRRGELWPLRTLGRLDIVIAASLVVVTTASGTVSCPS